LHPGQEGGIQLRELPEAARQIARLPNIRIAGVTSYPCLQVDLERHGLVPTQNFQTILQAAEILRTELGILIEQINAPGHTCVAALPLLASMGATQGEVGHALTGTTYLHARLDQLELPALVYVSEISHCNAEHAYAFGGGLYRRAGARQALVQAEGGQRLLCDLLPFDPTAIDYYLAIRLPAGERLRVGAGVLISARAQIFVSRSLVAVVAGIQAGMPELAGLYDAWGRSVERFW
jgi:predicted amino acid racemase